MTGLPDFSHEQAAMSRGARLVAGVDEVGRGPLAGPVTAAAVVVRDPVNIPEGLNDSKKVGRKQREVLADWIMAHCDWSVAHVEVADIERLNIYHAAHLAMVRAVAGLRCRPCRVLVDGNRVPAALDRPAEAIVGGDARSLSIAAASILAKVLRDRIMVDLAQQHPGYGWEVNAGYPTPAHKRALLDLGLTPHHRRSFRPVHNILCKPRSSSP
ncbi:MAG: ribonuclease HII [Paracoccus sp. (in: a-proteobacteria)]|jgi:ribonuclease HII|uniref:ribonuclease HII n=1 Tax=unclassified Paracoccus (in: a-proteobacteria) TaxID=2688777 RepID=UPI000C510301|nr:MULTISPECIES: ribonuclease HII [unclassified Paracoccus (in: a-proteobacteria)]MAN55676.1 ribonuclease HII [Paracoccus sp. (in: a-proteobacteria)]MBA47776.1 ribonuclease HII [Paracoccus sp. (in: a-proteobacteria)]MCS5602699.1 ribonuclease HII [Paracoccus sp. (in: a-proteobacteria)]MDB2551702.1 ribonuclease HII [Paracoccus sp. (in: a-proteobacteria)]HIC64699.1 ribonuclease HII [Paracoccus sp. (in: a-proteobacteria)]|tara:strand:+ start:110 stop:748 length:639 start_codon:yes stop_codon:yes gene_type:complete